MAKRFRAPKARAGRRAYRPTVTGLEARALLSVGPDPTFGSSGTGSVVLPNGNGFDSDFAVTQLASRVVGGHVVPGQVVAINSYSEGNYQYDVLTGLTASGGTDKAFGTNGSLLLNGPSPMSDGSQQNYVTSIAALPNGRFVVAGSYYPGDSTGYGQMFYFFNLDPNATEAVAGNPVYSSATFPYSYAADGGYNTEQANAVAVESDGSVIGAGYAPDGNNKTQVALVQMTTGANQNALNSDPNFGTRGHEEVSIPGATSAGAEAVAIQNPGASEKILVAGAALVGTKYEYFVMRVNESNGSLDTTFGNQGVTLTPTAPGTSLQRAIDGPALSLTVTGQSIYLSSGSSVVRYTANGALDTTFGNGTGIMTNVADTAAGVGVVPDGTLVSLDGNNHVLPSGQVLTAFGPFISNSYIMSVTRYTGFPDHFVVSAAPTVTAGQPVGVTVTAMTAGGQVDTAYTGTVHFSATDTSAHLPANYTFVAGDGGTHTFAPGVTFGQSGAQTVSVSDPANPSVVDTAAVQVAPALVAPGVSLSATNASPVYGQSFAFVFTATPAVAGGPTPTGTVQFQVGGANLGSPVTLSGGSATSPTYAPTSAGGHAVTASYSGDPNDLAAGGSLNVAVAKAALTVNAVNVSVPFGSPIPTLTDTITGFVNGDTSAVVGGAPALSTTANASSAPGNYPITVGPGTLSAANYGFLFPGPGTLTITAPKASATATAVQSSKNPANPGDALTFTATVSVTPPGTGVPTGTVQFAVDGVPLGSPVALTSGAATSPTDTALTAPGNHAVTATYVSADGAFVGSVGTLAGGQTVSSAPASATVSGQVFADANANGRPDPAVPGGALAEQGIPGRTVYIDLNNAGVFQAGDPTAVTDASGGYTLTGLAAGTYTLRLLTYPGDQTTGPAGGGYQVTLTTGQALSGQNIGVEQVSTLLPIYPSTAPFGTNTDAVAAEITGFYRLVLNRLPEPGAVPFYENRIVNLRQGLNQIIFSFYHSPEYITNVVNEEYSSYLGRAATAGELTSHVAAFQAGKETQEQLAVSLLSSPEETALQPTGAGFVQALYQDIDGRQAAPAEVTYWTNALAGLTTRSSLASSLVHSTEAEDRAIVNVYSVLFARPASPGDLTYYQAELQAGAPLVNVAPGFLIGAEYKNRAAASLS